MKVSSKIYCFLCLLLLVTFSVLGTYDMLNLKSAFMVEGFETKAGSVTDSDGNTHYAAQGPRGNVAYGSIENTNESVNPNNPNNYNARAGSITDSDGNTYYAAQGPQGNIAYGKVDSDGNATVHTTGGPSNNGEIKGVTVTGPEGNTYYAVEGPRGNVVYGEEGSGEFGIYYPEDGIIIDETIPPNANNFIRKTQVVPPVCPACPYPPPPANNLDSNGQPQDLTNPNYPPPPNGNPQNGSLYSSTPTVDQMIEQIKKEKCPPCPACARCPEPAFECKKVPNYKSPASDNYLPMPVLNDFSSF